MQGHWKLLRLFKPYREAIALAFFFSLIYALFNAAAIWFSASFITTIFSPQTAPSQIPPGAAENLNAALKSLAWKIIGGTDRFEVIQRAAVIFFLAYLLRNIFDVLQYYYLAFIEHRFAKDLKDRIYTHLLAQSLGFFRQRKAGELQSVILNDASVLATQLTKVVASLMRDPLVMLIFLALLFTISWKLTCAAFLLLPLAGILIDQLGRSLKRKSARVQEALSGVTQLLQERLNGIHLIKIRGSEASEGKRFGGATQRHFKMALRQRRLDILNMPGTEILGLGIISIILVYGGFLVFRTQTMDAEDFIRFIALLFSALAPGKAMGTAYAALQTASASSDRIFNLLNADERLPMPAKPRAISTFKNAVVLDEVCYRYPGTLKDALQPTNLQIRRGENVAIVGPSGAGKTTLIGLILRLLDPTNGRISLDGITLNEIQMDQLRKLFGVVPQESVLFNESIRDNIAYGREGISEEEIRRAAKLASAEPFILSQPQGYDTIAGDRGARLSGGQQQRLSIARALVGDPPIIIFDEATSQLDSESEALIQQALETLRQDHTLIVIAHRLATIRKAERIIVIEEGRILDQGSYDDLWQRCELFNRLCRQQFLTPS